MFNPDITINKTLKRLEKAGIVEYIIKKSSSKKGCQIKHCNLVNHLRGSRKKLLMTPREVYEALVTIVESGDGSKSEVSYNGKILGIKPGAIETIKNVYKNRSEPNPKL